MSFEDLTHFKCLLNYVVFVLFSSRKFPERIKKTLHIYFWHFLSMKSLNPYQCSGRKFFHDPVKVTKIFSSSSSKDGTSDQLWSVANGRRGQGIQDITCKINKPKMTLKTFCMPFLFKPVKRMDTIRVVEFLFYESMMQMLCPKPSPFCDNKPSFYSCNIVGILIKRILFGGGVFLSNYNNVVFTWIICTRNINDW